MSGVWLLSWRYVGYNRTQTIILILCIALSMLIPITSARLMARYDTQLRSRAAATPMLVGAIGNRFDLTLTSLYFRQSNIDAIPWAQYEQLVADRQGLAIPLHIRFTARGAPIVGTTPEYFEQRRLVAVEGTLPLMLGQATLGSNVARALALRPGNALYSDQREIYDISKPPALKMHVVGVLQPSGTADDDAVFVDINTSWILEGALHGHAEPDEVRDPNLLYGRTEDRVVFNEALMQLHEVTPENIDAFHLHGDPGRLPLTSILFYPRDMRAGTIVKARINVGRDAQMLVPGEVIDDLMAFVIRVKAVFDALAVVLAVSTGLMLLLVMVLSVRLRRGEILTLHRIGCSRFTVVKLYLIEVLIILIAGGGLALSGLIAIESILPDLLKVL